MGESYPRRDQARGLWKINDITKNIIEEGTYPQGATRAIFAGGSTPSDSSVLDFITIEVPGNATDFGDLISAASLGTATSSNTRLVNMGSVSYPSYTTVCQYVQFLTTGNCADFGDLTNARDLSNNGNIGNGVRGICMGGYQHPARVNTIDFIIC